MKKFVSLLLIVISALYLCACNEDLPQAEDSACPDGHSFVFSRLITEKNEIRMPAEYKCENCKETEIRTITSEEIGIPFMAFEGDTSEMSKENEIKVAVNYVNGEQVLDCDASIKWQGSSSLMYPKKNFNIKLLKKGTDKKYKVELCEGWGEQNKYCLKANYIDASAARNVVSGKLYSQVVKSRNFNDQAESLSNGGAVDGFPILVYFNGVYEGLYTLNIPKDKWMLGMVDDENNGEVKQAILMADDWTESVALKAPITNDYKACGYDLEHCSTEDTIGDGWVVESFNDMINFINSNDGEAFKNGLSQYVNADRAIDTIIFTWLINGLDNCAKNILWVTYDGVQWYPSMYDMDGTWGISYNGSKYPPLGEDFYKSASNNLYDKMQENFSREITKRYYELRLSVLSRENILKEFSDFDAKIPAAVRDAELKRWNEVPSINYSSMEYITDFTDSSLAVLDKYYAGKVTELL